MLCYSWFSDEPSRYIALANEVTINIDTSHHKAFPPTVLKNCFLFFFFYLGISRDWVQQISLRSSVQMQWLVDKSSLQCIVHGFWRSIRPREAKTQHVSRVRRIINRAITSASVPFPIKVRIRSWTALLTKRTSIRGIIRQSAVGFQSSTHAWGRALAVLTKSLHHRDERLPSPHNG